MLLSVFIFIFVEVVKSLTLCCLFAPAWDVEICFAVFFSCVYLLFITDNSKSKKNIHFILE